MSQRAVEGILGRLITDSEFRRGFYADPAAMCVREALDLTTRELEALMTLDQSRLRTFASVLDARIVRAAVGGAHYWSGWMNSASHPRERAKVSGPAKQRLARVAK